MSSGHLAAQQGGQSGKGQTLLGLELGKRHGAHITRTAEFRATENYALRGWNEGGAKVPQSSMSDPHSPTSTLHVHLRAWRKSRNLTLEKLAEQTGGKVSTLSGWETGRRTMDMDDLATLAAFYGVHPAALLLAPGEAKDRIRDMQAASTIAEKMPKEAVVEWLAVGKRMLGQPM